MAQEEVDRLKARVEEEIQEAARFAEESPVPAPEALMADIYTTTGGAR